MLRPLLTRTALLLGTIAMMSGCEPLRDETDPLPAPGTPPEPTGLHVTGAVTRVLTWTAVAGATSYDVRFSRRSYGFGDPNKWEPWKLRDGITKPEYRLRAMGRYHRRFAVRARNEKGPGTWSATVEHTPGQPLHTVIDAAELIERWSIMPNGAVAQVEGAGRLAAAATDGFSDLPPTFRFTDIRQYGSCVVFTFKVTVYGSTDEGPYEAVVMVPAIDCVGAPVAGNPVQDGLFHIAHVCEFRDELHHYIIRAGDFDPVTRESPEEEDRTLVSASSMVHPQGLETTWDDFTWTEYIEPSPGHRVLVYWALGVGEGFHNFAKIEGAEQYRFVIDTSEGVFDIDDLDRVAVDDYLDRCSNQPAFFE